MIPKALFPSLFLCVTILVKRAFIADGMSTKIEYIDLKKMKGVPSLGRGYGATTNSLFSTCLEVNDAAIEHSYNYECEFNTIFYIFIYPDHLILILHILRLVSFQT